MATLVYSSQQKNADWLDGDLYSINTETQHMKLKLAARSLHLQTSACAHSLGMSIIIIVKDTVHGPAATSAPGLLRPSRPSDHRTGNVN